MVVDHAVVNWLSSSFRILLNRVKCLEEELQRLTKQTSTSSAKKPIKLFDLLECSHSQTRRTDVSNFMFNPKASDFIPKFELPDDFTFAEGEDEIVCQSDFTQSERHAFDFGDLSHDAAPETCGSLGKDKARLRHVADGSNKSGATPEDGRLSMPTILAPKVGDALAATTIHNAFRKYHVWHKQECDDSRCCDLCSCQRPDANRKRMGHLELCSQCFIMQTQQMLRTWKRDFEERLNNKNVELFEQVKSFPSRSAALQRLLQLGCEMSHTCKILEQGCEREQANRGTSLIGTVTTSPTLSKKPRPPKTAYQLFVQERRPLLNGSIGEMANQLSMLWRTMGDTDRHTYESAAKDLKQHYDSEIRAFNGLRNN